MVQVRTRVKGYCALQHVIADNLFRGQNFAVQIRVDVSLTTVKPAHPMLGSQLASRRGAVVASRD